MSAEVGSPQEILDEWVIKNVFTGTKYDDFDDPEDIIRGAQLDGVVPQGADPEAFIALLGQSCGRVSLRKNFDLDKYPFVEV